MEPTKPTGPTKIVAVETNGIKLACEALRGGGLVAYPTESFYGIGARHDDERALKRLFALKGSREGKPFSLIIPDKESLEHICTGISETAQRLMERSRASIIRRYLRDPPFCMCSSRGSQKYHVQR